MIDGADCFLDTNILLYAALGGVSEPEKHASAQALLPKRFGVSGQVLAEFYANAIKKGAAPLAPRQAKQWVATLSRKPCQPIDAHLVRDAIELSDRYQISYWDGAIIAAAQRLGATTLYTEDLNHGQNYDGVRVINPFLEH